MPSLELQFESERCDDQCSGPSYILASIDNTILGNESIQFKNLSALMKSLRIGEYSYLLLIRNAVFENKTLGFAIDTATSCLYTDDELSDNCAVQKNLWCKEIGNFGRVMMS